MVIIKNNLTKFCSLGGGGGQNEYLSRDVDFSSSSVDLDDLLVSPKDSGSSNSSKDVGSGSIHKGHETFSLDDLDEAVDGSVVFNSFSGSHHHSSSDSVDGVGKETGGDSDRVAEEEDEEGVGALSHHGSDGVVESEVESSVDEDSDAGDDESSVESRNSVGGDGLSVDVDHAGVLSGSSLLGRLQVVGESGSAVVQRVDEGQRKGPGESS